MSTNTTESPITVTVDYDPRGVSVGVWQGSHCIYSGAHPLPAAPGASTAGNQQPARDWELTCHECDGSGHVYVKHQVAERKTDVQEFKEECECCEGRGFVFAFQDIPGIEEYVKACCPAPAAAGVSTVEDAGAHKVVIDFDQVGSAGPFYVFDGRVTIPAVTVMDLVRMAAPAAGDALDAARWRAYAAQFPEISAAFLAMHGTDPLPTIKGAAITSGYVVVTPAGWDADKATKLRDAILRLFPVNPAHTPRPSDEIAAQRKGDA